MSKIKVILLAVILLIGLLSMQFQKQEPISLTQKYYNEGNFIKIKSKDLNKLKNENYVLFTYNNYCNMAKPCEEVFKETMNKNKIDFLSITFEEFKNTKFYKEVKYAPSIIIVSKGKIIKYLDAEKDEDLDKYQDVKAFEKWLKKYVYLKNTK